MILYLILSPNGIIMGLKLFSFRNVFFILSLIFHLSAYCNEVCGNLFKGRVIASSFGYNKDDASNALVDAVNSEFDTIIIDRQKYDWVLKPLSFFGVKNKTILFEKDIVLRSKPFAFPKRTDALLRFVNCNNISIIGLNTIIKMNKEEYTDGEWRHGISLNNCKNIKLHNLTIESSGGDGIYIDGLGDNNGSFSNNILIDHIKSVNNKRQGMSIISGQNIEVTNSIFSDTKGTLPEAGVDLEPDHWSNRLVNINFRNCSFIRNGHAGIVLALGKLTSDSEPVSILFDNCYLSMNHRPDNSYVASEIVIASNDDFPVKGRAVFDNLIIDGSNWGMLYSSKSSTAYHVTFKNCYAKDICKEEGMTPIYFEVPEYFKASGPVGGFSFKDMLIDYSVKNNKVNSNFLVVKGASLRTLKGFHNVNGEFTLRTTNNENGIKYIKYNRRLNKNVNIKFTNILE